MIKIAIEYAPSIRGTKVYIWEEKEGDIYTYLPVELAKKAIPVNDPMQPTFVFPGRKGDEFLREFVNALVLAGYKPDEVKAHDREVAALKYHLEDMRTLVFHK